MLTTGFHHLALPVKDIDKSIEWYTQIFGFEIYQDGRGRELKHVFLSVGENQQLGLFEHEDAEFVKVKVRRQFPHIVFQSEKEGFEAILKNLETMGVRAPEPAPSGTGLGTFFRDPSGYSIEILTKK